MHSVISLDDALKLGNIVYVDMRSPGEYAQGHIPGAVNIPLFSNEERATVGTIYKQIGVEDAKQQGLSIVSAKLPLIVSEIRSLYKSGRTVIVYCWRGGMRSKSVVTILELMGIRAYQLLGGYKAYRRHVLEKLSNFPLQPQVVVLCGSTGVGKTTILKRLIEQGIPAIDLERLANHRGSAFGQIGLGRPQTAQNFDALLLNELVRLNEQSYLVVECESKRIGNVYLPDPLYDAMQRGIRILMTADMDIRVRRLIAEYTDLFNVDQDVIRGSINTLRRRLGEKKTDWLLDKLDFGQLNEVVETLLKDYYDPLYGYENASDDRFNLVVDVNDMEQAVEQISNYLRQMGR